MGKWCQGCHQPLKQCTCGTEVEGNKWNRRAHAFNEHGSGHVAPDEPDFELCAACGGLIIGLHYKVDKKGNCYHMGCA